MRNHRLAALMCLLASPALAQVRAVPAAAGRVGVPAVIAPAASFALPYGGVPAPVLAAGIGDLKPAQVQIYAGPVVHAGAFAHMVSRLGGRQLTFAEGRHTFTTDGPKQAAVAAKVLSQVVGPTSIYLHPKVHDKLYKQLPAVNGLAEHAAELVESLKVDPYHGLAQFFDGSDEKLAAGAVPTGPARLSAALEESVPGRPLSVHYDDVNNLQKETVRVIRRNDMNDAAHKYALAGAFWSALALGAAFLPGWAMSAAAALATTGALFLLASFYVNRGLIGDKKMTRGPLIAASLLLPGMALIPGLVIALARGLGRWYAGGAVGAPLALLALAVAVAFLIERSPLAKAKG